MIYEKIEPFTDGKFSFHGAYKVAGYDGYNLLISRKGTSVILSGGLLARLEQRVPDDDLKFVLVQHFFAEVENCNYDKLHDAGIMPTYFILDLTKACNFSCSYCFRDDKQTDVTPKERLEKNLEYIRNFYHGNNLRRIAVQPWGGEPLIAFDMIEFMMKFFRSNDINAKVEMETNGSLVTDGIAEKLKDMGISVGVSIDGPEKLHDSQRKFLNGTGTYRQVINGIRSLQKYYGRGIGTISVITKNNAPYVKEMIDDFVCNLNLKYFKFNVVRENPFSREENLCPSVDEVQAVYRTLFDLICASVGTENEFIEDTIRSRLANVLLSPGKNCCNSRGCTGGLSIISFDKNGDIFPCEMTDFVDERIATVNNPDLIGQIAESRQNNKYFLEKYCENCKDCPWWPYCRGGCSSRVKYMGKCGQIDEIECSINRTIYPLACDLIVRDREKAYKILEI